MLTVDILTLFPGIFTGPLTESIIKRAQDKGLLKVNVHNLRDYTEDKHRTADDKPYGGGSGMVLKPEPIFTAVDKLRQPNSQLLLTSPQGEKFDQELAQGLVAHDHLIFICGHYEGVDERVRTGLGPREISIGDYILTNGSLAAMVIIDVCARLVPGVLGNPESLKSESFQEGLLEYPQYTRPSEYRGMRVPPELVSGDHKLIENWRRLEAGKRTRERRPDLLNKKQCE